MNIPYKSRQLCCKKTRKGASFTIGGGKQTNILAAIDSKEISHTTTGRNFLWQSEASTGTKSEVMHLANIQVPANNINFQGTGGISVQIPKGSNLSTQIATLAKQPGNEYLGELANRSDIDWKQVELINKSWNYSKSGLTPEAKIIVGIAVSFLLPPGAGAGLFQSATGIALTGPAAAMANAALVTLTTQTSIAILNNKGDLGAALKELGSKDNIKALVTSIATAGILDKIGGEFGLNTNPKTATFGQLLGGNLVNSVTSSLINTAVYGGSLEENLKNALKTGFINAAGAMGANAIGDLKLDDLGAAIAHGILGCAIGSATAGSSSGCAAGAAGGAVGEYAAKWYGEAIGINGITDPKALEKAKADVINFAKLTSAIVAGAGGAEGMNLAVLTGGNAATNNYLNHRQLTSLDKALKDCDAKKCSQTDREKILIEYANESKKNDAALAACTTQACVDFHKNEIAEASKIERNVLFNIDGKLGNELRGRQVKVEALKTQYEKVQFYENEAKEFANFYKAKCATGSMSDCVQAYTNMKSGNIQWLADLKVNAKDYWLSYADDPNQTAAKTFMAVTGMTLAELLPTHTAEIAAMLPYGRLAAGGKSLVTNYLGVSENVFLDSSLGLIIKPTPNITTTVLGTYKDDTRYFIEGVLDSPKTTDFGAKPGSFNLLNVPDDLANASAKLGPDGFWNTYNKPFLDAAISRGDDIVLATKVHPSTLNRVLPDGSIVRSGFGKEFDYLISKGYTYNIYTSKMVRGVMK